MVYTGAQSCPAFCSCMDCSRPGSPFYVIFQARILEYVTISSSRGSSGPRDQIYISCSFCIGRQILYHWAGLQRLPWWLRWSRICLQCRRSRFDTWVRKIPWRFSSRPDSLRMQSFMSVIWLLNSVTHLEFWKHSTSHIKTSVGLIWPVQLPACDWVYAVLATLISGLVQITVLQ